MYKEAACCVVQYLFEMFISWSPLWTCNKINAGNEIIMIVVNVSIYLFS